MKVTKLKLILPSIMFVAVLPFSSSAAEVKVEFIEGKKFSDYEMSGQTRKKSLKVLEKEMLNLFTELSNEVIGKQGVLSIKVKNVDLPGNIRYGMGQTSHDIRVIDNATLFRLDFEYALKNAEGAVLKQGEHQLKEFTDAQPTSLQMRNRSALGYFERPLKKWMKETFSE